MKKGVITIVVCLIAIVGHAQEHLRFMDIPLDGTLDNFCNKLIGEKGLSASKMIKDEQYYDMAERRLTGTFYGIKNCNFDVRQHERLDYVSSVMVWNDQSALSEDETKRIITLFDEKYGEHETVDSRSSSWYTWRTTSGEVEIYKPDKGFTVWFQDYTELNILNVISEEKQRERERQTIKEICGIPFGSSYEKVKEVLYNKYGTPSIFSDKTKISYENKSYAGISFDNIIFLFQSDGYKSYLNGCVFILEATSLAKAKEKRELLYEKLRWKYNMKEDVDDDGIKYYYGGYSPIPYDGFGFAIDIIKYNNRSSIPYAARLMYGRYNYVKEEF